MHANSLAIIVAYSRGGAIIAAMLLRAVEPGTATP